jgi:hypothetical protein
MITDYKDRPDEPDHPDTTSAQTLCRRTAGLPRLPMIAPDMLAMRETFGAGPKTDISPIYSAVNLS